MPATRALAAITLLLLSCTQYVKRYIICAPVAGEATAIVVPMTTSEADMRAADRVTEAALGCGLAILERPSLYSERKAVEGTSGSTGVALVGSTVGVASSSTDVKGNMVTSSDPVELLTRTNADYVVFARAENVDEEEESWIRIVKRDDSRILFSGKLPYEMDIRDLLEGVGAVKKSPLE